MTTEPERGRVFLSYSSTDKRWADAACAVLESKGVRCWVAPRDIPPGTEWGASIIAGLDACRVLVLIFSDSANRSPQVRREVERAVSKELIIVPCRIEDARPVGALEYALSNMHWLDVFTPPVEEQLQRLAKAVQAVLSAGAGADATSAAPPCRQGSITARKAPQWPMGARSAPQVRQTRTNELTIAASIDTALEMVGDAINRLGAIKRRDAQLHVIEGRVRYGLQSVEVRASLVERVLGETTVVIQASSDDVWAAGAKNATTRLVETLLNLDNPGYKPARLGMHPAALVGLLIGFMILVILIMKFVWPLVLR